MYNNSLARRTIVRASSHLQACRLAAGVFLWICLGGLAQAADVYVSRAADGVPVYTNEARDTSSRLFLKGEREGSVSRVSGRDDDSLRRRREALDPLIREVAARNRLDPALVRAIAHVESQFDSRAVSPAGAQGVMQLMPGTAKKYGTTDRGDPAQNLEAGARYFRDLLDQYKGNVALALAAYNSGENNVERHARRVPPFRETMLYVPEVLTRYESYRRAEAAGAR